MNDTVFSLVSAYGPWAIFASAFLSCLALPIPTSLMMLTGGAFIAAGDLDPWPVIAGAYAGAVLGDQTGYLIGRTGGTAAVDRLARAPARAAVLTKARRVFDRHGGIGVFFSTWLVAPLGPWVNFVAGAAGLRWVRFTLWDVLGETIWVSVYVGLGYGFASQVSTVAEVMGDAIGLVMALVVAVATGWWIRAVLKAQAGKGVNRVRTSDPT